LQLKAITQKLEVGNLNDALRNLGKLARPLVDGAEHWNP
jgi:hypothetical protein